MRAARLALYRQLVAGFLIVMILSTYVAAFGGTQNSVIIQNPSGYLPPENNAYLIEGSADVTFDLCTDISGSCSADCDSRLNYVELFRVTNIEPSEVKTEVELAELLAQGQLDMMDYMYVEGNHDSGVQCFAVKMNQPGYYYFTIGAFGSPSRGGLSSDFGSGFIRLISTGAVVCSQDGQIGLEGEGHQYICNDDGTYRSCSNGMTTYDEPIRCKDICGAVAGCEGFKPNPSCKSSCISSDGKTVINAGDVTTIDSERPNGDLAEVEITDGAITDTTLNDVPVTSKNDQTLTTEIKLYNEDTANTAVPTDVSEQSPGVDVMKNGFNITSFKIGDSDDNQAYSQFQKVNFGSELKGDASANLTMTLTMVNENGTRTQIRVRNIKLDANGAGAFSGDFYPLVADGNYKALIEMYQGKEKRNFRYWVNESPGAGVLVISFNPAALVSQINTNMASAADGDKLLALFLAFQKARLEKGGAMNALPEFKAFMEEYLKVLYPDPDDYANAMKLLDDDKLAETARAFENDVKKANYDKYLLEGEGVAEDILTSYNFRLKAFDKSWLQTTWDEVKKLLSFDFIGFVRDLIKLGTKKADKAILEYKINQMEHIKGVFALGRSVDYGALYPLASDPAKSDEDVKAVLGAASASYGDEIEMKRLRRPFYDYVITRDLMADIYNDKTAGVVYGYCWMYFYSSLTTYEGSPADYTDYPLRLGNGASVDISSYPSTAKKGHDQIIGFGNWGSATNWLEPIMDDDADIAMEYSLYNFASTTSGVVIDEYSDYPADPNNYAELAQDRMDDIKGIQTRQNVVKGVEMMINFAIGFAAGSGLSSLASNAMKAGGNIAKAMSTLGTVLQGVAVYNWGRMGYQLFYECPKYYLPGGEYSELSEAQQTMASGEWMTRCVAPAFNFAMMTWSISKIQKNMDQAKADLTTNDPSAAASLQPKNFLGKIVNGLVNTPGKLINKVFGVKVSAAPASSAAEVGASFKAGISENAAAISGSEMNAAGKSAGIKSIVIDAKSVAVSVFPDKIVISDAVARNLVGNQLVYGGDIIRTPFE